MSTTLPNSGLVTTDAIDHDKQKKSKGKRGDCPTCGMKMFKISGNQLLAFSSKKKQTPVVSKNGKVTNSRCLVCHPLEADEQEDHFAVPKILMFERGEDESEISDITLDRRLQQPGDNPHPSSHPSRPPDELKTSRPQKAKPFDDQDLESLTDSENDDDGATPKNRKCPQHRSGRSINNSSHHNAISLSSSARNRWGESEAGLDADSTGPRPLPPKRVPSGDGEKNQSLHQSLPSRVTASTVCNTTTQSSPQPRSGSPHQRSGSPKPRSGSNYNSRIPLIVIPHSPAKKSNFTPPWNPKNQSNETSNARKPLDAGKIEIDNVGEEKRDRSNHSNEVKEIVFISNQTPDYKSSKIASTSKGAKEKREDLKRQGITVKEITLFGNSNSGPKSIPDFDEKASNHGMLKTRDHDLRQRSAVVDEAKEIHVDLTSFAQRSMRKSFSSPSKDVTPRTLKRQKALNMLVQMEQIFPPEHVTSRKPPKKVPRMASTEIDLVAVRKGGKVKENSGTNIDEMYVEDASGISASKNMKLLLSTIVNQEQSEKRINILHLIADQMWGPDSSLARKEFTQENGVEVLATLLWTEMMRPNIQTEILKVLFAVAAGQCEDSTSEISPLAADGADVIIDALMTTMSQHASIEELQLLGCQVLCCLASELSASFDVNDGTQSGAIAAVLTAMEAHRDTVALQEWGIRALYNHCVYSTYAEKNKRTILTTKLEHPLCANGSGHCSGGSDVLLRILKTSSKPQSNHKFLLERTCKLYKALCTTRSVTETLSPATDLLRNLLSIIRTNNKKLIEEDCESDSNDLVEDTICIISCLLNVDHNKACVNTTDVFVLMLDTMSSRKDNSDIVLLCCSIMSKLAPEQSLRKSALLGVGAIQRIIDAMMDHSSDVILQEAGFRSLACLSLGLEAAKQQLCTHNTLSSLIKLCKENIGLESGGPSLIQENMCTLIASLYSSERLQSAALQCDTLSLLQMAMERSSNNTKLQEVSIVALMNLSTGTNVHYLLNGNIVELIVSAMEYNRYSVVIQTNACCTLWNIGVNTERGIDQVMSTNAIDCIVAALQNHVQNQDVVEMACGSLWGLSENSIEFKKHLLSVEGAVEAIAWTLVMHPNCPPLQEKSCGVLSTLVPSVDVANIDCALKGMTNIVEAIMSNPRSISVLQSGSRFLTQILTHVPQSSTEACDVIPILISAIEEYSDASIFHEDVCHLLSTMSDQSQEAKKCVLSRDNTYILSQVLKNITCEESPGKAGLNSLKNLVSQVANR